ncbi:MAG: glycosyltransferase family 9 protein [Desulfovermiculus sp.]
MGALGDIARGLCLVSHIKSHFPASSITWLVEPKWREIVSQHPQIDNILIFDRPRWRQGIRDIYHRLSTARFDCVLDLQRHFKSGLFSFFTRAPNRVGFHPRDTKEGNWLFNTHHLQQQGNDLPKISHYLKFAEALGLEPPKVLDFGLSHLNIDTVNPDLTISLTKRYWVVILGSTWVTKEWCADKYASLIHELLLRTDMQIVLVDAKSKYDLACALEKDINNSRLLNLVGQTSVVELAALLQGAQGAVGPDCGAGHIASAVHTPYVSLFGPTSHIRTAPFQSEHLVVTADVPCAPCYKKKCPGKNRECMRALGVSQVMDKISQVIGEHKERHAQ